MVIRKVQTSYRFLVEETIQNELNSEYSENSMGKNKRKFRKVRDTETAFPEKRQEWKLFEPLVDVLASEFPPQSRLVFISAQS